MKRLVEVCPNCGMSVGKKFIHAVGIDDKGNLVYSCESCLDEEFNEVE